MPTRKKTTPAQVAAIADLAAADTPTREIAAATGVARRTVRDILGDIGPEVNELRDLKRDEMLAAWQHTYFDAYDEMTRQAQAGKLSAGDRQRLAIVMGISTEKAALMSGHPTQLVANIHEVRVSMPELVQKLQQVARVIDSEICSARGD